MLRGQKEIKDSWHHRMNFKTEIEVGWTVSKNERQGVDQALQRVATKEREQIKMTTKQVCRMI